MNGAEIRRLGATELLRRYRDGSLTPADAVRAAFERIDALQPSLNAFVALRRDEAIAEAEASGERWREGNPCGALDGVALAVKDSLPTIDLPTTWGCVALAGHRTGYDELAVARARAAGAIVLGKTNVPEFTIEGYTSNRLFGTTRNPWNPALTPGGSSGGAVAAVASGMAPLALGTDGGGSIRRPASHTGLVGLKPSIGAVARDRVLPQVLLDFEVVGPIARTTADAALLFTAIRGPAASDRRSLAAQAGRRLPDAPLRVLYVPAIDESPVDRQIAASCEAAARRLESLGHRVETGELPLDLAEVNAAWPLVGQIGLAWLFEQQPDWRAGASEKYLELAELGAAQPASRLWQILAAVDRLRRDSETLFERCDLIVTPAAAALPWPAEQAFPPEIDGRPVGPRGHAVFTGWVNAAGLPALALPAAPSDAGLPIGIQLIGPYASDDSLLALGAAIEKAAPWAGRWPPLPDT